MPMALELLPLATGRVGVRPIVWIPNTPLGTRLVGELSFFDIEGERLRAHMFGVAALGVVVRWRDVLTIIASAADAVRQRRAVTLSGVVGSRQGMRIERDAPESPCPSRQSPAASARACP